MTASSPLRMHMFQENPFLPKIKLFYLVFCVIAGMYAGLGHSPSQWPTLIPDSILWGAIGLAIGCVALWVERQLMACSRSTLVGGSLGLMAGMAGIGLLILGMGLGLPQIPSLTPWVRLPAFLLCPYIGLVIGIHISNTLSPTPIAELPKDSSPHASLTPRSFHDSPMCFA